MAVETDPRLREISYGAWDGHRWEEMERSGAPPGGESYEEFTSRVRSAWNSIRDSPARVTVVVAHLGVNAVLLDNFELRQEYGSAVKVTI